MRVHYRALILGVALGMATISTPRGDAEAQTRLERAVAMVVPLGDANRYWPRWRGPSGQGLAVGTGYPDRWSDTENVLWKTPVAGRGHSSPIVWADRLFLTTAYNDGRVSVLVFPPLGRQDALGGVRAARSHARIPPPEKQPGVGDAGDRRRSRVRVVRQQGAPRGRFRGPRCLAPVARRDQRLPRHRWFSASL